MNIFITFDYELYFGKEHGSLNKCILEPTNYLIDIAKKHQVNFTFFVDCGYILKLKEEQTKHLKLKEEYRQITTQIRELHNQGHDIQLHIHPHWEDSYFDGNSWIIDIKRYRLHAFSPNEITNIVTRYSNIITELTGTKPNAFRAGGWCIQPFEQIKEQLKTVGIKYDSTVFAGGKFESEHYFYDFLNAPKKDKWTFSNDPLVENTNGEFTELPISAQKVSPLFFWKLFLLGRLNPQFHKPIGNGKPIPAPGQRKKILTSITTQPVSIDGYNAKLLFKNLKRSKRTNDHLIAIGHPKALSHFSINALDEFIAQAKQSHTFTTFNIYDKTN